MSFATSFATLEEQLQAVKDELQSLGSSPDGEEQERWGEKLLAENRALEYLSGNFETLMALGTEMTAALIVALYPKHLFLSLQTQLIFNEMARKDAIQNSHLPFVMIHALADWPQPEVTTDEVTNLLNPNREGILENAEHRIFCIECLFLASQVRDLTKGETAKIHQKQEEPNVAE